MRLKRPTIYCLTLIGTLGLLVASCDKARNHSIDYVKLQATTDSIKQIRNRKFIFSEKDKDLGVINSDVKTILISFPYHNTTGRTLYIHTVASSCGCMKAVKSRVVIRPNEEDSLLFNLDLASEQGHFQKTAKVFFQGMEDKPVFLTIKGEKSI